MNTITRMPTVASSSPGTAPVVQVVGLRKTYGSKVAVDDVSFEVARGEIVGILGQNGAGKTTTVEALAGLRTADGGTVRVLGHDPQRDPAPVRELLGVQLQESRLPAKLRVAEALRLYASFYADPRDPEELLTLLGLQDKRDTPYQKLSGGQKQRLSIALALVGNPQVAILDELTTGLDPQARRETWDLIEAVRDSGVTIVLVTHFMDEAERLCDRVVIIDDGRVIAQGTPGDLARGDHAGVTFRMRLPQPLDAALLVGIDSVTSMREVGRDLEVTGGATVLPDVIIALHSCGLVPEEVQTISPSLEDAFVALVGRPPQEDPS
ncbi:ABC transporter ATP-binding protein [Ornithinimicrobium murale]|uniref:ABC transporter ATP-binding protein n=1 Tax=Ornithinimicrobium murale TaxID=1050153 RepID=UPI001EDCBDD0|nr:ABC transporter ATP-binding protein [Ornithinimicrobium murale]